MTTIPLPLLLAALTPSGGGPSLSFVFLNNPIFQMFTPGLPKLLRPRVGKAPISA